MPLISHPKPRPCPRKPEPLRYLSVDTQLFFVAPYLALLAYVRPNLTMALCGVLMACFATLSDLTSHERVRP